MNKKSYYGHALTLPDDDKRKKRYRKQRKKRGFDDTETWSLDLTIVKFVLPRLKRFYEVADDVIEIDYHEGFREAIEEMIEGFEIMVGPDYCCLHPDSEEYNKVENAWDKLSEYHALLWW